MPKFCVSIIFNQPPAHTQPTMSAEKHMELREMEEGQTPADAVRKATLGGVGQGSAVGDLFDVNGAKFWKVSGT